MTAASRSASLLHKLDAGNIHERMVHGDPAALAVYSRFQANLIGPDPMAEGAHDWPVWSPATSTLGPARPLTGWRCWAVLVTTDGPRLVAPFITQVHHADPSTPGLTWAPGINRSSSVGCPVRRGRHPLPTTPEKPCRCGIRIVQSLTILKAFALDQAPRIGEQFAYAEVAVWGRTAPAAIADDWERTLRAELARIAGPLHLAPALAEHTAALAEHYGLEVITDELIAPKIKPRKTPTYIPCRAGHWGPNGASGLLIVNDGSVLLQLRSGNVHNPHTWSVPGGARGKDETPQDAALREATEEIGLNPDTLKIVAQHTHPCECGWCYTTFVGVAHHWVRGPLTHAGNWEGQLEWVPLDDVDALQLHPGFRRSWPALQVLARDATNADVSRVTDRVWTGADRGGQSMIGYLAQLESVGITHVIDCRPEGTRDQRTAQTTRVEYLLNGQPDNGQRMPDQWFDTGVDYALAALADPDAQVLVHCHEGINRGPSMALAVLLAQGMDAGTALAAIRTARPIAEISYARDAISWWQRRYA
jgi:dual specificity phosphatase 3